MQSNWLAATNFERMHEVVSAINTLEIHAKLTLAGVDDPTPAPEIESARKHLLLFLDQLAAAVEDAETAANGRIVSSDPRLSELAHRQLARSEHGNSQARSGAMSPTALHELISVGDEGNPRKIVPELERLRTLVEEHMQADVDGILGDESW